MVADLLTAALVDFFCFVFDAANSTAHSLYMTFLAEL